MNKFLLKMAKKWRPEAKEGNRWLVEKPFVKKKVELELVSGGVHHVNKLTRNKWDLIGNFEWGISPSGR